MKNVNCEKDVQVMFCEGMDSISRNYGRDIHISLVESPDTSPGIPDIDICINQLERRIELKYAREDEQVFKLRPTQYRWFKNRYRAGGRPMLFACIHIDDQNSWCLFLTQTVLKLKYHSGMDKRTLRRIANLAEGRWDGEPDWNEVVDVITSSTEELDKLHVEVST